ncbi:hypothetical protein KSS87_010353 [Heliosperma pusillum]|nr:hypothetical protein KSS87_010353 [Heliosperma pusillum]
MDSNQPIEVWVKDLLSRLTLEEKVGQKKLIDREVASCDAVKTFNRGSVLS